MCQAGTKTSEGTTQKTKTQILGLVGPPPTNTNVQVQVQNQQKCQFSVTPKPPLIPMATHESCQHGQHKRQKQGFWVWWHHHPPPLCKSSSSVEECPTQWKHRIQHSTSVIQSSHRRGSFCDVLDSTVNKHRITSIFTMLHANHSGNVGPLC